jgi:hypothetical protein
MLGVLAAGFALAAAPAVTGCAPIAAGRSIPCFIKPFEPVADAEAGRVTRITAIVEVYCNDPLVSHTLRYSLRYQHDENSTALPGSWPVMTSRTDDRLPSLDPDRPTVYPATYYGCKPGFWVVYASAAAVVKAPQGVTYRPGVWSSPYLETSCR